MKLKYGTRGSALAVAQSGRAADDIRRANPGLELERVIVQTSGDRFSAASPGAVAGDALGDGAVQATAERPGAFPGGASGDGGAAENVKAMFVKEIEEALLSGSIDFAIHSSKDLPADLPPGLIIGAYPKREDPRDVFIAGPGVSSWRQLKPGQKVATASLRRQIQLRLSRPGLEFVTIRGNIDTRLRRLTEGRASGLVLAKAGLNRLDLKVAHEILPEDVLIPAPGQGALAIEARADRFEVLRVLSGVDHAPTRLEVECERALLAKVGGGCLTPFGAIASVAAGRLTLSSFWSDAQGLNPIRWKGDSAVDPTSVASLVSRAAQHLLKTA